MGKKTQQNFLNIGSQYNAKTINQTLENIQHWAMHLSLPSYPNCSYQTCTLDDRMSEWDNEALTSFIYTNCRVLERCLFTGHGRLVFLVVKITLIRPGGWLLNLHNIIRVWPIYKMGFGQVQICNMIILLVMRPLSLGHATKGHCPDVVTRWGQCHTVRYRWT